MSPALFLVMIAVSATSRTGLVVHETSTQAYLNAGRDDGLAPGQKIQLYRRHRAASVCLVTLVSDHRAVCTSSDAAIGDTFAFPKREVLTAQNSGPFAPGPADTLTVFSETVVHPVDFHGTTALGAVLGRGALKVSVGHTSWLQSGSRGTHKETLDIDVRGISLGFLGAKLFARATMMAWSDRPTNASFRPDARFQLYVWEAEVATREVGRNYAVGVGRLWPYHLPGLSVLDGAQVAYRSTTGAFEAGGYIGTRPDPLTTMPGIDRWSMGGYYALTYRGTSALRLLLHEARVGVRNVIGLGPQLEAEAMAMANVQQWFTIGVGARGALDGFRTARFDNARAHMTVQPMQTLRATAAVRYLSRTGDDLDSIASASAMGDLAVGIGPRIYGSLDATYLPLPALQLGLAGFASSAPLETSQRFGVGPEIGFPTAIGRFGGVYLSHREELGYMAGRTTSVAMMLRPAYGTRVAVRASYYETASLVDPTTPLREVQLTAWADARLWRWLGARAAVMMRTSVPALQLGGTLSVDLVAQL